MTPFDRVAKLYDQYPQPRSFDEDIAAHISTGYLASTPDFFIMGRGVVKGACPHLIADPWYSFPVEQQDTWLVFAFAGDSRKYLAFLPYPLTWVAWQRRGNALRFYEFGKIKAKCEHTTLSSTPSSPNRVFASVEASPAFLNRSR